MQRSAKIFLVASSVLATGIVAALLASRPDQEHTQQAAQPEAITPPSSPLIEPTELVSGQQQTPQPVTTTVTVEEETPTKADKPEAQIQVLTPYPGITIEVDEQQNATVKISAQAYTNAHFNLKYSHESEDKTAMLLNSNGNNFELFIQGVPETGEFMDRSERVHIIGGRGGLSFEIDGILSGSPDHVREELEGLGVDDRLTLDVVSPDRRLSLGQAEGFYSRTSITKQAAQLLFAVSEYGSSRDLEPDASDKARKKIEALSVGIFTFPSPGPEAQDVHTQPVGKSQGI